MNYAFIIRVVVEAAQCKFLSNDMSAFHSPMREAIECVTYYIRRGLIIATVVQEPLVDVGKQDCNPGRAFLDLCQVF